MGTARYAIEPSVLEWAIRRSGADLSRKFPEIADWQSRKSEPTLRQMEEFARAAAVPLGYLFLATPPEEPLPIPYFRTKNGRQTGTFSPGLRETVYSMQRRQAWMREYLVDAGYEPLPFVHSASLASDPLAVARQMRTTLGMEMDWASRKGTWTEALRSLEDKAEDAGILVSVNSVVGNNTHRKLSVEEFRGFVLVDEYAPLIFINGADAKAAQMFTLAHEMAHIWLGQSAAFDLENLQPAPSGSEQISNRIAAEFLVPEEALRALWPEARRQDKPFEVVASRFRVSEIVAVRRLLDLGLIDRSELMNFYELYQWTERKGPKGREGGIFYATQAQRLSKGFARAVAIAVRQGDLGYQEAYRLTGLYGKTFEKFAGFALEG